MIFIYSLVSFIIVYLFSSYISQQKLKQDRCALELHILLHCRIKHSKVSRIIVYQMCYLWFIWILSAFTSRGLGHHKSIYTQYLASTQICKILLIIIFQITKSCQNYITLCIAYTEIRWCNMHVALSLFMFDLILTMPYVMTKLAHYAVLRHFQDHYYHFKLIRSCNQAST